MCVDFTDLNKAYPKDSYPFPRVDVLVDSTAQHQLLSFMDVFWLQPDQNRRSGSGEDFVHHQPRPLLLQSDVIRPKKCEHNILEAHEQNVHTLNWKKCPSLC